MCLKVILPGIIFPLLIASSSTHGNHTETAKVIINGTLVEVTTVKIAEISNHTNKTLILKEITAKHFTTTTPMPKVILIPPANHKSQIKRQKNEKNA